MADSYLGEIRIFAGTFAPAGWLYCDGSLLQISAYDSLFMLIGTTYGGDGQNSFALPDLRSRVPVHTGTLAGGNNYALGATGGQENVTLTGNQVALHSHPAPATGAGQALSPQGALFAAQPSSSFNLYSSATPTASLNAASISPTGGNSPHTNIQPSIGLGYIISVSGNYPSPT